MPVVSVAFCPHPPVLVPEVAAGAAAELADLRAACLDAVAALAGAAPDAVIILGAGPANGWHGSAACGSLAAYGVPGPLPGATVAAPNGRRSGGRPAAHPLPLSLTIGAWLLDRAAVGVPAYAVAVADGEPAPTLAADLTSLGGRVALLVMGDGAACHGEKAPGYAHPDAAGFDAAVAAAMSTGDAAALRDLDPPTGRRVLAAGVLVWRVAGALLDDRRWSGRLRRHEAPYGVGYLVADWQQA
ncbi:hypothetical protein [Pilimelia columellifera]|uniref:Class III extradiol dioxygenase subunit B-like domain-containing protein n=1 Tax=Pilimelia columellifera subsp. columellifera TaxID=706583 RepID=A0ABN3N3M7_9ACTN